MNTSFLIDLCEDMVFSPKPTPTIHGPQGGRGGTPNFKWHGWSNGDKNRNPNLQIVSNTPKNSYLNQAPQKNTCQNFPTQTKSWNQKFQTQKNPLIIPVTWNPKSLPPPPGSWTQALINTSYWPLWSRHLHLHRRTGWGGEGGCSPLKFWATQSFWAARENLGKASF